MSLSGRLTLPLPERKKEDQEVSDGIVFLNSFLLPVTFLGVSSTTFSLLTVSLTVSVSVTGSFVTTTSSLTYGRFVTSTSSLVTGTLTSVLASTGLAVSATVSALAGLLSTLTSSCVTGTSMVFVSVTGSLAMVTSSVLTFFETSSLSSMRGILVSTSAGMSVFLYCVAYSSYCGAVSRLNFVTSALPTSNHSVWPS